MIGHAVQIDGVGPHLHAVDVAAGELDLGRFVGAEDALRDDRHALGRQAINPPLRLAGEIAPGELAVFLQRLVELRQLCRSELAAPKDF